MGIAPESFLDLQSQPIHASPHVRSPHRQPHPHARGTGIIGAPELRQAGTAPRCRHQHRRSRAACSPARSHAPGPRRHRRPNVGTTTAGTRPARLRRALATGAAPSEQQRRRNAVAASSRRHQPRSTQALGDDPKLLLFGPSSPAARIDHLKPFDLRNVRMTGHTHCLQRSTQAAQGGPRRRLTVLWDCERCWQRFPPRLHLFPTLLVLIGVGRATFVSLGRPLHADPAPRERRRPAPTLADIEATRRESIR